MNNIGVKTSADKSIFTDKDHELTMSSKFTAFKIFKTGVVQTDGSGFVEVKHGLGFTPTFSVFRMGSATWQETLTGVDSNTYNNVYFPSLTGHHSWVANQNLVETSTSINSLYIESGGANIYYKYYIFYDLGQFFSDVPGSNLGNQGLKVSFNNKNVLTSGDYNMGFTSKYKILQFNKFKSGQTQMTLPALKGSQFSDPTPQEATYLDIFHGMGYPPFFLAFNIDPSYSSTIWREIPDNGDSAVGVVDKVSSWCDATRIRISWWRKTSYATGVSHNATTITIKWLIFDEDLRL